MSKIELKPCPFCGGKAAVINSGVMIGQVYIACRDCYANTKSDSTVEKAMEAWNRRTHKVKVNRRAE